MNVTSLISNYYQNDNYNNWYKVDRISLVLKNFPSFTNFEEFPVLLILKNFPSFINFEEFP
jgi:hypothetical protein